MSDDPPRTESPAELSAAASAEWIRHVENVLRGVAHALNNRAAALAALVELTSEPAEAPAVLREIVSTEQQRVRDLVQVIRALGPPRAGEEAFLPVDVVQEVALLLDHYPAMRDGGMQIDATQAAPVRAPRWAFARALLALSAGLAGAPARMVITTDGDWLVICSDAGTEQAPPISALARELARHMGGEPLAGAYGIRLPTLAALRQREGR